MGLDGSALYQFGYAVDPPSSLHLNLAVGPERADGSVGAASWA
jgi:hypothetical protein